MKADRQSSAIEPPPSGGVWALPLLALGLGLVACCYLIPAADDTRQVMSERQRLETELASLKRQVALNAEFLDRVHSDRELAMRLAARQRTQHEEGVGILSSTEARPGAGGLGNFAMSPFALVAAEPATQQPAPVPAVGGQLAALCRDARARLVVLGIGMLACMIGLLGGGGRQARRSH